MLLRGRQEGGEKSESDDNDERDEMKQKHLRKALLFLEL